MRFFTSSAAPLLLLVLVLSSCKDDIGGPLPPGPPWILYNAANSPLVDDRINAIMVDRSGYVWFATDSGASFFMPAQKSWGLIRDSLSYDIGGMVRHSVTALAEGKDRSIWFGLRGGGVARFNPYSQVGKTWTKYRTQISSDFVTSIAADRSAQTAYGEVWVTTFLGVNRWHQLDADNGLWDDLTSILPVRSVLSSATNVFNQRIWLGSASGDAAELYYDVGLRWNYIADPALPSRVNGMAFDGGNNAWLAKETGITQINLATGIVRHPTIPGPGTLPAGEIHAVETNLDILRWFGTDSGLVSLSDTTWSRLDTSNCPLPDNTITALKYDRSGNLWIGTLRGVAVYNPGGTRF